MVHAAKLGLRPVLQDFLSMPSKCCQLQKVTRLPLKSRPAWLRFLLQYRLDDPWASEDVRALLVWEVSPRMKSAPWAPSIDDADAKTKKNSGDQSRITGMSGFRRVYDSWSITMQRSCLQLLLHAEPRSSSCLAYVRAARVRQRTWYVVVEVRFEFSLRSWCQDRRLRSTQNSS